MKLFLLSFFFFFILLVFQKTPKDKNLSYNTQVAPVNMVDI